VLLEIQSGHGQASCQCGLAYTRSASERMLCDQTLPRWRERQEAALVTQCCPSRAEQKQRACQSADCRLHTLIPTLHLGRRSFITRRTSHGVISALFLLQRSLDAQRRRSCLRCPRRAPQIRLAEKLLPIAGITPRKARWVLPHHSEIGTVDPELQVEIELHTCFLGYSRCNRSGPPVRYRAQAIP